MNNKRDTIELVNYEGPALRLTKLSGNNFSIINQWGEEISKMDRTQLLDFLMGNLGISCARGKKTWICTEQSLEARVDTEDVESFLFN